MSTYKAGQTSQEYDVKEHKGKNQLPTKLVSIFFSLMVRNYGRSLQESDENQLSSVWLRSNDEMCADKVIRRIKVEEIRKKSESDQIVQSKKIRMELINLSHKLSWKDILVLSNKTSLSSGHTHTSPVGQG